MLEAHGELVQAPARTCLWAYSRITVRTRTARLVHTTHSPSPRLFALPLFFFGGREFSHEIVILQPATLTILQLDYATSRRPMLAPIGIRGCESLTRRSS